MTTRHATNKRFGDTLCRREMSFTPYLFAAKRRRLVRLRIHLQTLTRESQYNMRSAFHWRVIRSSRLAYGGVYCNRLLCTQTDDPRCHRARRSRLLMSSRYSWMYDHTHRPPGRSSCARARVPRTFCSAIWSKADRYNRIHASVEMKTTIAYHGHTGQPAAAAGADTGVRGQLVRAL